WRLGQGADHGRMARVAEAWDRSTAPGATSRSTISSASVRLQRLRLACRSDARLIPTLATRHGRARPGHACLWTDILNSLCPWRAMPKKAKSKANPKAKLNIKKSKKGRRAAPPKRRKVAVSIPALEAAATKAGDFAAKHEAAAAESKGAAEQRRSDADAARQ